MRFSVLRLAAFALHRSWQVGMVLCLGCQSGATSIDFAADLAHGRPAHHAALGRLEAAPSLDTPLFIPLAPRPQIESSLAQANFQPFTPANKNTVAQPDPLTQAMDCLNVGEQEKACEHLRRYVAAHPDRKQARAFFAEVLVKLDRVHEARTQFEEIIASSLESPKPDLQHLVHSHGRLLELSERSDSDFEEHLHRGLGLYWLAKQRQEIGELEELPLEVILVKSASELQNAYACNRRDARSCVYLHAIWKQLGQKAQAERWLNRARESTIFTALHPAEQHVLEVAFRAQLDQSWSRR